MARFSSLSLVLVGLGVGVGPVPGFTLEPGAGPAVSTAASPADSLLLLPTLAAAIGPTWAVSSTGKVGLAVDVTVGAVLGWPGRGQPLFSRDERFLKAALWLQPEFGYSYRRADAAAPQSGGHLGSLGLGVGYGNLLFLSGAYTPRLVLGSLGGDSGGVLAAGLRHGIAGHFLGRLFSAELSHEMLWTGGELRHELRLLCGLNAGALLVPWL